MERKGVPNELLQSLKDVEGFDEKAFIEVHENSNQVVSIRINPEKIKASPFPDSEQIPWSSTGYYLPNRPSFTLDPLLHAGAYYVQEASGMFLEQCLKQTVDLSLPLKILDLCAAPGGKSTLIQSFISDESLLVSNEVIKSRASILVENISKWGNENVIVTNNDPRDFKRLPEYFDVIVADAPCSGSGLFRRDENAIGEWSIDAVESCSLRQQRILSDAYVSLKQNGVLIYSTCSYSPEENEKICDWLLRTYDVTPLKIAVNPNWNIVYTESDLRAAGYRFFPDKIRGEGFFIACFRKNDGASTAEVRTNRSKMVKVTAAERDILLPWIRENYKLNFYHNGDEVFAFPSLLEEELLTVHSNLYIKKAGVPIGKIVRSELLPAHELALSNIVSHGVLTISLKKDGALQYLRKEEVTIKDDLRGWALVRYEEQNLGWVKLLGNRINNYYPKEWRILKSGND